EQTLEQFGIHFAAPCEHTIAIIAARDAVDDHAPRSGVERDHLFRRRTGWYHSDVGNAADVQRHTPDGLAAKQQIVDVRNKRSALAARGHIAGAEIGDYRNAGTLSDDCRFPDLHGAGHLIAEQIDRIAFMED